MRLCVMISAGLILLLAVAIPLPPAVGDTPDAALQFGKIVVPIEGNFGNGWRQTIVLPPTPHIAGGQVSVSVEDGWLCVRRDATDGQCEWQFVLCRIDEESPPTIQIMNGLPTFIEISSHDGRYFIRESAGILHSPARIRVGVQATREKRPAELRCPNTGIWRHMRRLAQTRIGFLSLQDQIVNRGEPSYVLMLMETPGGYGVSTSVNGPTYYFHADTWFIDDGELLVAKRMSLAAYEARQRHEAARKAVLAGQLPAIDATNWLNSDQSANVGIDCAAK